MTSCVGIAGWLFGHKMREFVIKSEPNEVVMLAAIADFYLESWNRADAIEAATVETSIVRCARCGQAPEGQP